MKSYFYNHKEYSGTELTKLLGDFLNKDLDVYELDSSDIPTYADIYLFPSSIRYETDDEQKTYNRIITYLDRPLLDIKYLALEKVKCDACEATKECCGGIDPTLVALSAPEDFADIKAHLGAIASQLATKLAGIEAAETIEEIKAIVDEPFEAHDHE
jgi:hypothetical protein